MTPSPPPSGYTDYDDLTRWLDSPVERVFAHVLRAVAHDYRGAEPES